MSQIFEAVRKHSVIDFSDICQAQEENPKAFVDMNAIRVPSVEEEGPEASVDAAEEPIHVAPPLSLAPESYRVLRLRASALSPVFPFDKARHPAAEQYRIIRTKLLHHPSKPQLVVVSSAWSGDGKTITSINIAGSLALKSDSRILLIDGDLRYSRVSHELNIPVGPGLTDVLSGAVEFEKAAIRAEQFPNLFILSAGTPAVHAAELLDSQNWRDLLTKVRSLFGNVILDAPPVAAVADYEVLQLASDAVVLIARPDHSDRTAFLRALQTVPERKLLGIVLNCVEDWWLWKTPTYGSY